VANTVNWGVHTFHVLSMEADWNDEPGVYIFAGIQADALWHAYYVGSAESFKARLQNHEQWLPACRLGASHVHAMVVAVQAEREQIEQELIGTYRPYLNTRPGWSAPVSTE
jgi:excinuclease UvrABC nuclease subunit